MWLTAAVGMACGASLPLLAVTVTAGHFVVAFGFTLVEPHLPGSKSAQSRLHVSYRDREDMLEEILAACTMHRFAVRSMKLERKPGEPQPDEAGTPVVTLTLALEGETPILELARKLGESARILAVEAGR